MKLLLLFVAAVAAGPMDMMDMPMGNGDAGMGEAMGMPMPDDVMDMVGHVAMKMKMVKMLAMKKMMCKMGMEDMEMPMEPTPEQMTAVLGEDLAAKGCHAMETCMCPDAEEMMDEVMSMVQGMSVEDMQAGMQEMMECPHAEEMMQMVGELHHCMLADMEWLCPMGGPNYEVIREDMGGMCHGECMEQMCCHMAQMIQPECIKELMEGCPDELSDMLLEEIGGMAEMMMQGDMPEMPMCECIYEGMEMDCPVLAGVRTVAYFDCLHDAVSHACMMGSMMPEM